MSEVIVVTSGKGGVTTITSLILFPPKLIY